MKFVFDFSLKFILFGTAFIGLLSALGITAGCASKTDMYKDLSAVRDQAYRKWEKSRKEEDVSKIRLRGPLSLQDGLKIALSHNKSILAALQEKEIAEAVVLESYSEALPRISATAGYTRLDEVNSFDVGGVSVELGDVDNYSAGLRVSQPLFRGGAIPAALRTARWVSLLADEQVRETVQSVIYNVAKDYFDVLLARHLYTVNRDAVASAEAHLHDVKIKRNQGVASDFDVLRAQVDVSIFEAEMIQQRNRIHLAKARLLKSLSATQSSKVELSDSLTYEPMQPVLEEAVRLAYKNRPDLYQAELNVRIQQEALRVAKSGYWPKIEAWFREEWSKPDPHSSMVMNWGDAWSAGVSATWSLFDGFGREGRIRQEKERLKQQVIALMDAEEKTLLDIQQAILSLRDAEEFVQTQKMNLERAKEALRLAEVGYREGIEESVKVTEARSALTRARGLYYEAVYTHSLARLVMQRAMGILGPRAGLFEAPGGGTTTPGIIEEFSSGSPGGYPKPGSQKHPEGER